MNDIPNSRNWPHEMRLELHFGVYAILSRVTFPFGRERCTIPTF